MSDEMRFIGSYKLLSIGSEFTDNNAFANKYLVERQDQCAQYVVKVFRCGHEVDKLREAFLREARCLAEMNHPHILPVLDYGVENDRCYLVSKYTSHDSLRDRLSRGERLPLETVFHFIKQIAEALQYAHSRNMVHGDIKPENILFPEKEEAVLADFSLACLQSEHITTKKLPLQRKCTAQQHCNLDDLITEDNCRHINVEDNVYRAPEQLRGFMSPRSDQYSLAVITYEWLVGTLPPVNSHNVLKLIPDQRRKMEQDGARHRSLPDEIEQAILKALAKDPTNRYASMESFVHALGLTIDKKQKPVQQIWKEKHLSSFSDPTLSDPWEDTNDATLLQRHDTFPLLTTCLTKFYVKQAFAALPWIERNCLLLYVDAEFTQSDIAAILDLDKQAVQCHLKRASKQWLQTYTSLVEKDLGVSPVVSTMAHPEETIACVKKFVQAQSR